MNNQGLSIDDVRYLLFDHAQLTDEEVIENAEYPLGLSELDRVNIASRALKIHKEKQTMTSFDLGLEHEIFAGTRDVSKLLKAFEFMSHEFEFIMPIIRDEIEGEL